MSIWRGRGLDGGFFVLGTRIPAVTGGLIALVLGISILGALGAQAGAPLREGVVLVPQLLWSGELWRMVTWVLLAADPLGLIFACLMLWWFGTDLNHAWGARRFLAVCLGFVAAAALVTCLVGLMWPRVGVSLYYGPWPLVDALIIAWALMYPNRQILLYFVLPVNGRAFLYLTIGGTFLYALFWGFHAFIPHFAAEGLMLVYMRGISPRYLWLRFKFAVATRRGRVLRMTDRRHERDEPPRWLH